MCSFRNIKINYMKRTSKEYIYGREYEENLRLYKESRLDRLNNEPGHLATLLLDSSLITETIPKIYYDYKIINCGEYIQVYKRKIKILRNASNEYEPNNYKKEIKLLNKMKSEFDIDNLKKIHDDSYDEKYKKIDIKNIYRSKNNMCRLIMTNNKEFKTFITLTFSEDMRDIKVANNEFHKFMIKLRRKYNNLKYVSVLEFTKKNRIHYHMITNIDYNNDILINENISLKKLYNKINKKTIVIKENIYIKSDIKNKINDFDICLRKNNNKWENTKKTYNYKSKNNKVFKTIKYWNEGFSNVLNLNEICGNNVSAYMSKYMTKDIDNRLFGFRKYSYSYNLDRPVIEYLDSSNEIDKFKIDLEFDNEVKYFNKYKDSFGNEVEFYEIVRS